MSRAGSPQSIRLAIGCGSCAAVGGRDHVVPFGSEEPGEQRAVGRVILDDEDGRVGLARGVGAGAVGRDVLVPRGSPGRTVESLFKHAHECMPSPDGTRPREDHGEQPTGQPKGRPGLRYPSGRYVAAGAADQPEPATRCSDAAGSPSSGSRVIPIRG